MAKKIAAAMANARPITAGPTRLTTFAYGASRTPWAPPCLSSGAWPPAVASAPLERHVRAARRRHDGEDPVHDEPEQRQDG
jgi:hypothetical protein